MELNLPLPRFTFIKEMDHRLQDIATIQTGIFAKPGRTGELVYLHSRHFDENGQLLSDLTPDLPEIGLAKKHILQDGDVLFIAKGTRNEAFVYQRHHPPAVASTSFFVIRPIANSISSDYLAWFLNSPATQVILKGNASGTSIPSISKTALENMIISIPKKDTQEIILEIARLRRKEKHLIQEIDSLRQKKIQHLIHSALIKTS